VAPIIRDHFQRLADVDGGVVHPTAIPAVEDIEQLIDTAFWASLRREEGYAPKISLALIPPDVAVQPVVFGRSLALLPTALVKVAPAVERPGIHLGVWKIDGELRVWGAVRTITRVCLVLEVAAPGLLVVKHHRGSAGKFINVAVLEGDQIKMIDDNASRLPDCPSLLTSLLGFESSSSWDGSVNVLVQLSVSMRAHGRGGAMLLVPAGTGRWRESIVNPVPYVVSPEYAELTHLVAVPGDARDRGWQDALDDAVQAIAGLTAVDGATVLTDRYELLAFGAKITRRGDSPLVDRLVVTEPIKGATRAEVHPNRIGGTRHLSAAQFVHDQRDTVALVASQDGRFSIFAWSPCENLVHAHRVEVLLL
jgi:hypothetical protein